MYCRFELSPCVCGFPCCAPLVVLWCVVVLRPLRSLSPLLFCFAHPAPLPTLHVLCCGRLHSRTTLSGSRYQGRTPPNVGARTPCPKAKARAGSNTRHGLPHSTCTLLTSGHASPHRHKQLVLFGSLGSGQAPESLPKGPLVEQGRHPPGPCSRDLVSATWVPARLAEKSRGGSGRGTGTPLPKGSRRCCQSLPRLYAAVTVTQK